MRFLNKDQKEKIGYEYILEQINTVTSVGTDLKQNARPYTKLREKELVKELDNTDIFLNFIVKKKDIDSEISFCMCRFKDLRATFKKIKDNRVMDEIELFEIKSFSKLCADIKREYEKANIEIDEILFKDVSQVFKILDPDNLNIDTFFIYDSYSLQLKELRQKRNSIESKIAGVKNADEQNLLLSERLQLVALENEIEYNIKSDLTKKINIYANDLIHNTNTIGYMDYLLAKAHFFNSSNAKKPDIFIDKYDVNDISQLDMTQVYNPYYAHILSKKNKKMTPLDIKIDKGVTLLTGANMGGKSICMKTVALNVLLANLGMYVYSDNAKIPIVDFIYMISDDLQNVENGLSTFGAEIIYLKKIISASKHKNGLIILDELARGTNPHEGKILLQSVIEFFKTQDSYTFISTHFDGISYEDIKHLQVVGISKINFEKLAQLIDLNKSKALDIIQEYMDYSIETSSEDEIPQNALQIAKLLGLDSTSL
ncbi:MAG: hypothetical protein WBH44_06875 [Proteocatella sp.]